MRVGYEPATGSGKARQARQARRLPSYRTMSSMNPVRRLLGSTAILLAVACTRGDVDVVDSTGGSQAPPPAAALYGPEAGVGLKDRLDRLEADLTAVLDGGLDDESQLYLMRAEATTDRLLEDEPDFAWLGSGYFVEARLRQIQALADRIVAEVRRGVARELVMGDIAALRLSITDLRDQLQQAGNGAAPTPLDSLLAAHEDPLQGRLPGRASGGTAGSADTTSTPAPEPAPRPAPGLLGEPIQL